MNKPTIELRGDELLLSLPHHSEDSIIWQHSIVPCTEDGLRIIRKILRARNREVRSTIGMNGAPTRQMVEKWLSTERAEREKQIDPDFAKELA